MNELKIFENQEFGKVRVQEIKNEPWFVAKDVCDILELSNSRMALENLEEDEVSKTYITDLLGRMQETNVINESGLYALIIRSNKPNAKKFRKWVTSEVLPSIRKHGAYMTDDTLKQALTSPDFLIQLATELKNEKEERMRLENKVQEDKPKVLFANSVETSKTSILIGDLAKLIKQNGYDIGQNRLFNWLRDNGYLIKSGQSRNMPTQMGMDLGLFEVKERALDNPDSSVRIIRTTKVNGKGQIYFLNKFLGNGVC